MARKKRRKSRKKSFKINFSLIIGIFILISIIGLLFLAGRTLSSWPMFKVKAIDSPFSVGSKLESITKGKSIFKVDLKAFYKTIKRQHPEFKNIQVKKSFPATIKISAVRRMPFVQVRKKSKYYVLDNEYMLIDVLGDTGHKELMTVDLGYADIYFAKGKIIHDIRIETAYRLFKALKKTDIYRRFKIDSINATNKESVSFIINNVNIISGKDNFETKLDLLDQLLKEKYKDRLNTLRYIDLRYASSIDTIYVGNRR